MFDPRILSLQAEEYVKEHAYRKFRKYGASAVIATQSIQDLFTSKVGMAIYENSVTQFLLGQKETSLELVKKESKLVLDDTLRKSSSVRRHGIGTPAGRMGLGVLAVSAEGGG